MKHEHITAAARPISPELAENCAELTIACSDSAGQIAAVTQQLKSDLNLLNHLQDVTLTLEADQKLAFDAAKDAKLLAGRAKDRIVHSFGRVEESISDYRNLAQLLRRLGSHVTDFAVVLEQVRSVSQSISTIARTTNMLALNASIEAERAGEAGRTFSVVASEIKRLAQDTRTATDDITRSIGSLMSEAEEIISDIAQGADHGTRVESNFASIGVDLEQAIDLVKDVDRNSDNIMGSTSLVLTTGTMVRTALNDFSQNVRQASESLDHTSTGVTTMEATANDMFNSMVQLGHLPGDSDFVSRALAARDHFAQLGETAIAAGDIDTASFFDEQYVLIEGSSPPRFSSALCDWATRMWQPQLDAILASDQRIMACVCSDRNGFLPTHMSIMSEPPTGDLSHDTQYSRNGRIIMGAADVRAKTSDDPYFMSVYRHENDGNTYFVIRNVYVPLFIAGKRWGDFEIAYRI